MKKFDRIEMAIEDIDRNQTLLTKVSMNDIYAYAKEHNLVWKFEEIGRQQKLDLIKSIIKNNRIKMSAEQKH